MFKSLKFLWGKALYAGIALRNIWLILSSQEIARLQQESKISLNRFEQRIYSQKGEDGVINEIFNRIGTTNRKFFEFGAGSGLENNTLALVVQGWTGWWIDRGKKYQRLAEIHKRSIEEGRLTIIDAIVTPKNINAIVTKAGMPRDLDLLSIDVDGNDYYIWQALDAVKPRVVVIEYNAAYPPGTFFLQEESETFWDGTNFFGASLSAINKMATAKGYTLVCCETMGGNAFFVRSDLVGDKFDHAGDEQAAWRPPRYYLRQFQGHPPGIGRWVDH